MSGKQDEEYDGTEELGEVEETGPSKVDLDCPECSAQLTWDPAADALSCGYCGHEEAVERVDDEIEERPLHEAGDAARGFGVEVRVSRCENCNARVAFEGRETSTDCVFCGSASVLNQEANRNAIRPESLIPLDISQDQVARRFGRWIGKLWFRPNALKKLKAFDAVGVYLPAWTFDCLVDSRWTADSGTYYWVTESYTTTENGKTVTRTRQVRKTRWRPARGSRDDRFNDYQVLASRAVKRDLAERLGSFKTRELVPYQPEYLAGWHAEEYSIDLDGGWSRARKGIAARQKERCARDVPGDTYRNLHVRNRFDDVRWKHVLFPIWSLTYEFRGKTYAVLVHGQNGNVVGDAPYSVWKILALVLVIAAVVGGVLVASQGGS